jgi:hypothetical protein
LVNQTFHQPTGRIAAAGKANDAFQERQFGLQPVNFNRDIRPILSDNCFACHGPDEKQRQARLRFDTREGAFAKTGVLVPGDAARSKLIQRVTATDPAMLMPPPESGHKLAVAQIELLRRWIDEGAKWETHWAYLAPKRPEAPKVSNAALAGWPRSPVDHFILARLEQEGLQPSPEAEKMTLLRRVSLDLTGLPPTPAEVDAFLADRSPDAYERVVDRLLGSPRYGERMAMHWLDLARYADTHGYHVDSHRDMWPWRDWVIKAFNQNKPYDQFTIEQLAGDLLPPASTKEATLDQRLASGFNRNHMINFEGGAIPEEYLVEYVVDRVETTSNVWLGMTMGCARCHSHKYDPITQKEFYQFFAFFNTVAEEGLDGLTGNAKPFLPLPTPGQKARQDALVAAIEKKEEALVDKAVTAAQEDWERRFAGRIADTPRDKLLAHYELDGSFSDISGRYRHGWTVQGDPTFGAGQVGRAVNFDGDTQVSFGAFNENGDRDDALSLAAWLRPLSVLSNTPFTVFTRLADAETRRGYEFILDDLELIGIHRWAAHLTIRFTSHWPDNALVVRTTRKLALSEWRHTALTYDGSGKAAGLKLYLDGKPHEVAVVQDRLSGSFRTGAELQLGDKRFGKPYRGGVDDLRIYRRALRAEEIELIALHYPVQSILSGVGGKPSKEETARIRDYFLTYVAPDSWRQQYAELKALKQEKERLEKQILTVMVMSEMAKPRETFVLARGDYRDKTEKVTPGVPAALPSLQPRDREGAASPPDRLALAKWLVDPRHPLTARVAVNRYWQMYFGHGIVKTSEDFGSQGEPPAHPELLDWLATEFIRTGWDIKAMQRLIVTSATYRQASKVTPALLEKDPENRLLARGPRFRLPAEMVRDNALAAAGLINYEVGGPGVFPYQPKGLWEEMAYGAGFSAQSYTQGLGKDLYRRSLYTFWKRTVPPASLQTFDAPDREKCSARRALTNTPLQSLVLLNDPTYVEAARALAARALSEGGKEEAGRISFAFRLATARQPLAREARVLRELLTQQLARYRRDRKAALELLRVGESPLDARHEVAELAAWTTVANAILNLDETITKE